ncbi:MAG: BMP family ABC transporter substrate-binding protein [Firmicutes bacterium]|nr:BMP family ABC transporter substrate-binding protein [Bacillota bacterium]
MKKKLFVITMVLLLTFSLFACGQKETPAETDESATEETATEESTEETTEAADMKVAMVTDYGDITDQSFNQTTYEASKAFCDANGIEFVYKKPATDADADRIASIEEAIEDGFNVIVMPGFAFANAIYEVAPLYPDVKFVALDVSEYDLNFDGSGNPRDPEFEGSNVYSAVYQEELAGYMAGYAAVKLGYTKLGFLGGMAVPAVQRYGYGFVQGADAAAEESGISDIECKYIYGGQFYGDADITAVMDTWYGAGTEVVFACGGGIFTSAAEAAAKTNAKVIGVDVDQAAIIDGGYGEGMTVTSAMKGLAPTVNTVLGAILEGNWDEYKGQIQTLGLISDAPELNYVQLPESTQWADGFQVADYETLVGELFNGTRTVDASTDSVPADGSATPETKVVKVDHQGTIKG